MTTLTYEQAVALLANFAAHHKQIKYFGHGELWEINDALKRLPEYTVMWVVPISTDVCENVVDRGFWFLVRHRNWSERVNKGLLDLHRRKQQLR